MLSSVQAEIARLREQELAAAARSRPRVPPCEVGAQSRCRRAPWRLVAVLLVLAVLAAAPVIGTARAQDYDKPIVVPDEYASAPAPSPVWEDDSDSFVALIPRPLLLDPLDLTAFRGPWSPPGR